MTDSWASGLRARHGGDLWADSRVRRLRGITLPGVKRLESTGPTMARTSAGGPATDKARAQRLARGHQRKDSQ